MANISAVDLEYTVDSIGLLWNEIKGDRVFITGGTGFIGRWLLETLLYANEKFALGVEITVLSRDPDTFNANNPDIAKKVEWVKGDITSFSFPEKKFQYIIHAAASADARLYVDRPVDALDVIVNGTKRILEFSVLAEVKSFLLVSSGAVYGVQPNHIERMSEEFFGAPNQLLLNSIYAEGKRVAELMCSIYGRSHNIEIKIARCFAFVGPHLPLNWHFAIGNFIGNALKGEVIIVNGDGQSVRSYMYAADLIIWLMTVLVTGKHLRPYNIGSEEYISIETLAHKIAKLSGLNLSENVKVMMKNKGGKHHQYVPSNQRAREELNLRVTTSLDDAITRTLDWHKSNI